MIWLRDEFIGTEKILREIIAHSEENVLDDMTHDITSRPGDSGRLLSYEIHFVSDQDIVITSIRGSQPYLEWHRYEGYKALSDTLCTTQSLEPQVFDFLCILYLSHCFAPLASRYDAHAMQKYPVVKNRIHLTHQHPKSTWGQISLFPLVKQ